MYWHCPNCKEKVDFSKQMDYVFDENGEADFDPIKGLYFHTIQCDCGAIWIVTIDEMSI